MNKVTTFTCTQPCNNCPYRTDAPLRHWDKSEYEKLLALENNYMGTLYGCHKNNGSVCVGWLMKQDENNFPSITLRIALSQHKVTREYLDSLHSPAPLYISIKAMIKANYPKVLKTLFLLFLPISLMAQKYEIPKLKQYAPSIVFTFLAGASDGLRDAAMYRMDGYSQFWNGKQSMNNKYKNGDINQGAKYFGSTSFLVFTSDGAHLANAATHQFQSWSFVFAPYDNNRKFTHLLLKGLAYNTIRQVGHSLIYDVVFKP